MQKIEIKTIYDCQNEKKAYLRKNTVNSQQKRYI